MLSTLLPLLFPATFQGPVVNVSAPATAESQWTTSLSTYWMEPPEASGYLSGILAADRGSLWFDNNNRRKR